MESKSASLLFFARRSNREETEKELGARSRIIKYFMPPENGSSQTLTAGRTFFASKFYSVKVLQFLADCLNRRERNSFKRWKNEFQ